MFGMSRCVFVYFPEKQYQYYEYPRIIAAVSTVQKKVMHYKAMHKEVPSLEFRRIDIYTFLARVQHANSKLLYRELTFIKLSQFSVEHITLVCKWQKIELVTLIGKYALHYNSWWAFHDDYMYTTHYLLTVL